MFRNHYKNSAKGSIPGKEGFFGGSIRKKPGAWFFWGDVTITECSVHPKWLEIISIAMPITGVYIERARIIVCLVIVPLSTSLCNDNAFKVRAFKLRPKFTHSSTE